MALINNIAGVGALPAASPPEAPAKAVFSQICQLVGAAAASTPEGAAAAAIQQGINLLPPGELKKVLKILSSAAAFVKAAKQLFTGKMFTTGQYRLAERYADQVLSTSGPDTIKSYRDVPDDLVPEASLFFTVVFGVRITTDEDLWALDTGATAYLARPGYDFRGMGDAPDAAIQRAVFLKQTYFPASTYNTSTWDLDKFSEFPLAAPIPDPTTYGKLYTGPLPGGGQCTDGVILVDAGTPLSQVQTGTGAQGTGSDNTLLWIGGGLLALAGYLHYAGKKRKKRKTTV